MMNKLSKYLHIFLLLYVIIGGFFFYVLGATIDTIFIPTLDQPEDFCEDWTERVFRWYRTQDCVMFKNQMEELKYKHNKRMENRSSRKVPFLFFIASSITYLLMVLRPTLFFDKDSYLGYSTGMVASAVLLGVMLGIIMPIIYHALLPPPMEWFPEEFMEIRRARIELILNEITEMIQLGSQEGKGS
jgi:hypothetical protein